VSAYVVYDDLPERMRLPEELRRFWGAGNCVWPDGRGCCHCIAAVGPFVLISRNAGRGGPPQEMPVPADKGGRYRRCRSMTGHHSTLCPAHERARAAAVEPR
jgi:hypothetical protein